MTSALVHDLRTALTATAEGGERPQPVEEWYVDNGSHKNHISYKSIAYHADIEYEEWRTLDPRISFDANMSTKLLDWMRNVSDEELTARLDETLEGVDADEHNAAFKFTKFQRLGMSTWIDLPFDIHAVAKIPATELREMADYAPHEVQRKIPLVSSFAMLKGSCPDTTILDYPTWCGKTACSLAKAMLLLSPKRFDKLVKTFYVKRTGSIFHGTCELMVARMCIVAAAGNTFSHFKDTLARLIPVAQRKYPDHTFVLWHTMSKHYSVRKAHDLCRDGRTIVFWCIPVAEMNKVLRNDSDIAIACVITDEYTIDTPREKSGTTKSIVCHNLVAQATPQALVVATRGNRSWLKDLFGGTLHSPRSVAHLVRRRSFTEAQLALDQACKLNLMTLTTYRDLIRDDLRPFVPNGMDVHFVRSRTITAAAHILNSQVDMVPADFSAVLRHYVRNVYPTDESLRAIQRVANGYHTVDELVAVIENVRSSVPTIQAREHPIVRRLVDRIRELSVQCPLCWTDNCSGIKIFGCCGYCVCNQCFENVSRCPFCRTEVPSQYRRAEVPEVREVIDLTEEPTTTLYPSRPMFEMGREMNEDLRRYTSPSTNQVTNVVNTLHVLFQHCFHRVMIIVQKGSFQTVSTNLDNYLNVHLMGATTGFKIVRVDTSFSAKGTQFTKIKREFDNLDNPPMALLCYGMDPAFLYGTDLGKATAVVAVGDIDSKILTQATGRTIRPLIGRDPSLPVKMIKIYSGSHNLRRRPRPE